MIWLKKVKNFYKLAVKSNTKENIHVTTITPKRYANPPNYES